MVMLWRVHRAGHTFLTFFGESGLLENEPTAPAEQAHTTRRHSEKTDTEKGTRGQG